MEAFLHLAGELFLILCIQSILENMTASRRQSNLQKTISFGCYIASLILVLRFTETHLFRLLRSFLRFF